MHLDGLLSTIKRVARGVAKTNSTSKVQLLPSAWIHNSMLARCPFILFKDNSLLSKQSKRAFVHMLT